MKNVLVEFNDVRMLSVSQDPVFPNIFYFGDKESICVDVATKWVTDRETGATVRRDVKVFDAKDAYVCSCGRYFVNEKLANAHREYAEQKQFEEDERTGKDSSGDYSKEHSVDPIF